MLGWHVSVYRSRTDGAGPGGGRGGGERLAVWQGGLGCLDWVDRLIATGDAVSLGGDGYPLRYKGRASAVVPVVLDGPPGAHEVWPLAPEDVIDPAKWEGRTVVDRAVAEECDPDEWLIIEAFDES
jgi:hypothetical protein